MTIQEIKSWVFTASRDDLAELSSAIRLRHNMLASAIAFSFKKGDKVWFDAKTRGIVHGTFDSCKRKNCKVVADTGLTWTVSPSLLHRE